MSFGKRLNQLLLERDMSPATLSRMLGWNTGVISQYLNKPDRDPRLSTAVKIADALDVSLDWLAGRTEDQTINAQDGPVTTGLSKDESLLIGDYRECTPERRRTIAALTRDLRDQSKESGAALPSREEGAA